MIQVMQAIQNCLIDNGAIVDDIVFLDQTALQYSFDSPYGYNNQIHLFGEKEFIDAIEKNLDQYTSVYFLSKDNHGKHSTVVLTYNMDEVGVITIHFHKFGLFPTADEIVTVDGLYVVSLESAITRLLCDCIAGSTEAMEVFIDIMYDGYTEVLSRDQINMCKYCIYDLSDKMSIIGKTKQGKLVDIIREFNLPLPSWLEAEMLFK